MGYPSRESHSVVPFRNFNEEMKRSGIWESEHGGTSTTDNPRDNLASLYRPPFALMHHGPFEKVISQVFFCLWKLITSREVTLRSWISSFVTIITSNWITALACAVILAMYRPLSTSFLQILDIR